MDLEWWRDHEIDWYDGSIRGLDAELRRVVDRLEHLGLTDHVALTFTSDHGKEFFEHGNNWHGTNLYGHQTDVPLVFATTAIAPGEYTLFIDLGATPWEFIVSSWRAQVSYDAGNREALFGAFEYTPGRDLVRIPMTVETLPRSFDQLSWQFLDITDTGGTLALLWDTKLASVAFTLGT